MILYYVISSQDYRQRYKEWEIDRRTLQKQIENLESQRKAIAEKCEFVQVRKTTLCWCDSCVFFMVCLPWVRIFLPSVKPDCTFSHYYI